MDRDEIDGVTQFLVRQPELPDIGIGDGDGGLCLDRPQRGDEVGTVMSFRSSVSLPTTTAMMQCRDIPRRGVSRSRSASGSSPGPCREKYPG